MPILKSRHRKAAILQVPSPVIETRPSALVGAADFLKAIYVSKEIMARGETLILTNPATGETNRSGGSLSTPRPRKHASKSNIGEAKNRARRQKYGELRDRRKSAKIPVVSQRVTMTKSGS